MTFTQIDADGWVFQGTQIGKMDGNSDKMIAFSDERSIRSPRFVEGDTLTLYGYGDGLSTLTSKGVGGTLSSLWSGDSGTEVPSIRVQYTGGDDYSGWLEAIASGNTDYHIAR